MIQWLRLPMQGAGVQSLVRELRSHMSQDLVQPNKYIFKREREREKNPREFLGNPVVKTPKFPLERTQVPSLVGEPRSRKPSGFVTKK